MASGNSGGDRVPNNLQGLLKFCTEATKDEDPSSRQSLPPMSGERKQFLENALFNLQAQDPVKIMLEEVKIILEAGDTDEDKERMEEALEDLQMHVEDIDLANDFYKIGGYALFRPLLNHSHSGHRWRTADIIAAVAQNNPTSQQLLIEAELFPTLINMLERDNDEMSRVKALYAISCICREYPPGQDVFLTQCDGFSVLLRAIQSDVDKLQTKASFMLAALCTETPRYKETLINMGLLDELITMLDQTHSAYHEHLTRVLLILCEGNTQAQIECGRPELGLSNLLKKKVEDLQGKDEYQEELEYTRKLQQLCFQGGSGDVDR